MSNRENIEFMMTSGQQAGWPAGELAAQTESPQ
jgi:hypothetical protein